MNPDQYPSSGFSPSHHLKHPGTIVLIVLLLLVAAAGAFFAVRMFGLSSELTTANNKNDENAKTIKDLNAKITTLENAAKAAQDGMVGDVFTIKAWGVSFKVPVDLSDVRYSIVDDTAYIIGLPSNTNISYVEGAEANPQKYALGTITRSDKSVQANEFGAKVDGKKLGKYYFYTSWSFSPLKSGTASTGIYGAGDAAVQLENKVFMLINDEMLKTIEAAQ